MKRMRKLLLTSVVALTCCTSILSISKVLNASTDNDFNKAILNEGQTNDNYDVTNVTLTSKPKVTYEEGDIFDASALAFSLVYTESGVKKSEEGTYSDVNWTHKDEILTPAVNEITFSLKSNTNITFTLAITVNAKAGLIIDTATYLADRYTELDAIDFTRMSIYSRDAESTVTQLTTSDFTFYDGTTAIDASSLAAYKATVGEHTFKAVKGTDEVSFKLTIEDSTKVVWPYHYQAEAATNVKNINMTNASWANIPADGSSPSTWYCYANHCGAEGSTAQITDSTSYQFTCPTAGKYDLVARVWEKFARKTSNYAISINSSTDYQTVSSPDTLLPNSNQTDHNSEQIGNFSFFYVRFGTYTMNAGTNTIYMKDLLNDDETGSVCFDYFMLQPGNTITNSFDPVVVSYRDLDYPWNEDDCHNLTNTPIIHQEIAKDSMVYIKQNTNLSDAIHWYEDAIKPTDHLFTLLSMRIGGFNVEYDFNGKKYYPWGRQIGTSFISEIPIQEENISGLDTTKLGYQTATAKVNSWADGKVYSANFTVCVIK